MVYITDKTAIGTAVHANLQAIWAASTLNGRQTQLLVNRAM